jgi:hypothetical protein
MKLYKLLAVTALGIITFTGCTNLDETPYTFTSPSNFYKDANELDQSLMSTYNAFRSMAGNWQNIMRLEGCTEFGQPARSPKNDNQNINDWYNINSASNSFGNMWGRAYVAINYANTVLNRGEGINMDATKKAQMFAQARFLRAYCYYYLVRIFGGVPIVEHMTTSNEGLEVARNTVPETWDFIHKDLEYAEANLPEKGTSGYAAWRPTKAAVQALLGEAYLWRASMEDNSDFLKKSAEYSKKVIDSGKYSLLQDYKQLWHMFAGEAAKYNEESIYELAYAAISGQDNQMHRMFGCFGDSYYRAPDQGIDGVADEGGGSYFYLRTGPSIYAYESYADNDVRKQVFVTHGIAKKGDIQTYMEFVPEDKGHFPGTKGWQSCTPGNGKYYDFKTSASMLLSGNNWMLLRYSEVLLNYAEALNNMGQTAEAVKYLNMVHQRAGLAPITASDKESVDDAIFQERGWEFIGEGKIYFDELRTDRLGKNVYEFLKRGVAEKMNYFRPASFIPQKSFIWKIPQGDKDSNPLLEQNPDQISDPRFPLN